MSKDKPFKDGKRSDGKGGKEFDYPPGEPWKSESIPKTERAKIWKAHGKPKS